MSEEKDRIGRKKNSREIRRRQLRRRITFTVVIAAVFVAVVGAVRYFVARGNNSTSGTDSGLTAVSGSTTSDADEVLHLSFPQLIVDDVSSGTESSGTDASGTDTSDTGTDTGGTDTSGSAGTDADSITVSEFNQILTELYKNDYVLVDFYSLTSLTQENGYVTESLDLPEGKKPLIISERAVSYEGSSTDETTESSIGSAAEGIEVDSSGAVVNIVLDENGTSSTGAYDVMTCVDAFVEKYPDFSYNNARGILAVTGENGVLGYDSSDSQQSAELQKVVSALKDEGWIFASGTYGGISYGSEYSIVKEDAEKWQSEVAPQLGDTDILMLPEGGDIGSWEPYSEDNEKFSLLSGEGFAYYCVDNPEELTWIETGTNYVRQGMHEINTMTEFETFMDQGLEAYSDLVEKEAQQAAEDLNSGTDSSGTTDGSDQSDESGSDSQSQDIENIDQEV